MQKNSGTYLTQIVLRLESLKQIEGRITQQNNANNKANSQVFYQFILLLNLLQKELSTAESEHSDKTSPSLSCPHQQKVSTTKWTTNNSHRIVSFIKCRKIAAIIREIQMYQNQPYPLRVEPTIRVCFLTKFIQNTKTTVNGQPMPRCIYTFSSSSSFSSQSHFSIEQPADAILLQLRTFY